MGNLLGRQSTTVEQLEETNTLPYYYPPKSGNYFGPHFFMGGKKFDIVQPEAYLFGENSDLNLLGPRPHTFPYQSSNPNQPIRALKCLVNIRKDSLRLIRVARPQLKPEDLITNPDDPPEAAEHGPETDALYNLEFTFDADCPCSITVYYNCSEEMENKTVNFSLSCTNCRSDTVQYNAGSNQQFCLPSHVINPAILYKHSNQSAMTKWDYNNIPIAIQVCAECGPDYADHSHIAYAMFEGLPDETWTIKLLKQKQAISGVCYLLQEIYGIENKHDAGGPDGDAGVPDNEDDDYDDSSECVVCLSDSRDTLILPCKHLCLCSTCANQLRFQQSGCPICRQSFRALLQIRAVRKKSELPPLSETTANNEEDYESIHSSDSANDLPFDVNIPPGYEVIPLINAINGPVSAVSMTSLSVDGSERGRAPSSVSNLSIRSSSRRSWRKKKETIVVEVQNEVSPSHEDPDVVITRNGSGRKKRSHKKQGSIKKVPAKSLLQVAEAGEPSTSIESNVELNVVTDIESNKAVPSINPPEIEISEEQNTKDEPTIPPVSNSNDEMVKITSEVKDLYENAAQMTESGQSSNTSSSELLSQNDVRTSADQLDIFVEDGSFITPKKSDKQSEETV
uniref:E3 ubiquitin-protein ligase MGRN1-like isoform X1 n=1 Tax=Ciona intestinalis TaxID=7719 RepID=UPI000521A1A7|nr:E3 ubiquitin-protein ligase MGRN1-like isoform X1 [Ciona intestinalis]|eukprot:XP_009861688.1 E3 ubiquitin-protein ligase MGRN1-like isoform X1 [Ciona intestinalis]